MAGHCWVATLGTVFYACVMWASGIMQGLMWRAYDSNGFLQYSFIETVEAMHPFYLIRILGGVLYLSGALIMAFNLWKTAFGAQDRATPAAIPLPQPAQ